MPTGIGEVVFFGGKGPATFEEKRTVPYGIIVIDQADRMTIRKRRAPLTYS